MFPNVGGATPWGERLNGFAYLCMMVCTDNTAMRVFCVFCVCVGVCVCVCGGGGEARDMAWYLETVWGGGARDMAWYLETVWGGGELI